MKLFVKHSLKATIGGEELGSGLGFGCMGITAFYGDSMPDDQALHLLKSVYDDGCRVFDTAERYEQGGKYNESIVGEYLKTVPRDSYSIVTKYWPIPDDDVYTYETVKISLLASLQRLQMDYVDLYFAHRVLSLEGGLIFAETAKRLKEEGLVKEIGLSEVNGKWLREIHKVCPIDAVQQEWSLMTRNLEDELVPVCKELGVAIMAYR